MRNSLNIFVPYLTDAGWPKGWAVFNLAKEVWAAGDVKFTMYVSVSSTIFGRLLLSYVLELTLNMGVIGIAAAMVVDWSICAEVFLWRQRSGK